jgi:hypothetical protein
MWSLTTIRSAVVGFNRYRRHECVPWHHVARGRNGLVARQRITHWLRHTTLTWSNATTAMPWSTPTQATTTSPLLWLV